MAASALGRDVQRADRMVVEHRYRRPRRPDARCAGPVVVSGVRFGQGVHRRGPLPVRYRLLRGEGTRQGGARRCDRHQSTPCWPSTTISDASVLPEHELLVVDEAHELVDRVTGVATAELSATSLGIAHRRVGRLIAPELAQRLEPRPQPSPRHPRRHTGPHRRARRRDDHLSDRIARRSEQGPLGDRHLALTKRPAMAASARARSGDGTERHRSIPRLAS